MKVTYTNFGSLILRLQASLEFGERTQANALVFPDPALGDLIDRNWIEVVQLLAAAPRRGDQIGALENGEVLAHRLPRHVEARTQLAQGLAIVRAQPIKKLPAARVGQRLEHLIHGHNMQPFGCLSRAESFQARGRPTPPAPRRWGRSGRRRSR